MIYKNGKIILEPNEVCVYYNSCSFSNINNNLIKCWGCRENRDWKFVCDTNELSSKTRKLKNNQEY